MKTPHAAAVLPRKPLPWNTKKLTVLATVMPVAIDRGNGADHGVEKLAAKATWI